MVGRKEVVSQKSEMSLECWVAAVGDVRVLERDWRQGRKEEGERERKGEREELKGCGGRR